MIYLYLKTHNVTGKKYLGQTIRDPYKYKGSGVYWLNHVNKHGYDVTTEILLETQSKDEIIEKGLYYSKLWNIVESDTFANLCIESGDGGQVGIKRSEETKRKISEALKNPSEETRLRMSKASTGRFPNEETRRKIGAARIGYKHSEETKAKLSKSAIGRTHSEEAKKKMKGIPKSEETKAKLSKAFLGKSHPRITCPICLKTGGRSAMVRHHGLNGEKCNQNQFHANCLPSK